MLNGPTFLVGLTPTKILPTGDTQVDSRTLAASALPLHWAVPFYRSKFTDWLAGAVPNSYPNVDLLWDSVIVGPWGWPRSTAQARVPARRLLPLSAGRERSICQPGEFSIEKCNPALVS